MPHDEILTVPEAAELLKISAKTAYAWSHMDGFPAMKLGNTVRIPRSLLLSWVEAQATKERSFL